MLMIEGEVCASLRLVTQERSSGPLPLNNLANPNDSTSTQTVHDKQPPKKSTIITEEPHPVLRALL